MTTTNCACRNAVVTPSTLVAHNAEPTATESRALILFRCASQTSKSK
eukprot:CAMPEP_0204081482 /NCGR_PEP_ID=MMETSP0360-20130528/175598_1 /ASSEMBLY_ACC=CAM_ASM_000342 /TAXON_ID=268821 /ORGANISM="Scrippsiella Hangoei, Strain SHTV-5" /LENGTH=46 /DNA_ID= /DNA_START= /DNA_END= /DNA_ORIENTATION=